MSAQIEVRKLKMMCAPAQFRQGGIYKESALRYKRKEILEWI